MWSCAITDTAHAQRSYLAVERLSGDWEEDTSKTENTLWSSFGKYKPMANHAERICLFG